MNIDTQYNDLFKVVTNMIMEREQLIALIVRLQAETNRLRKKEGDNGKATPADETGTEDSSATG